MVMDDHDKNESAANRGQFDIVGSLPFYVLLDVVKYLYEADIVRSQRVWIHNGRSVSHPDV